MPQGMRKGTAMKKLLSVVLALVMVLMTASALIPTAWAESGEPSVGGGDEVATRPEGSWVYYEQNFDDEELQDLTDVELAQAIGWNDELDSTQTMLIQDGALRFVSTYYKAGSTTAAASKYSTTLLETGDARMSNTVTVIEYDLTLQRRVKGSDAVVVGEKSIAADGQDAKQMVHITMGSDTTGKLFATRFDAQGTINLRPMQGTHEFVSAEYTGDKLTLRSMDSVRIMNPVPAGTKLTDVEHQGSSKNGAYEATGFDVAYHVKAVIDPIAGAYYLMINDVIVSTLKDDNDFAGALRALIANIMNSAVLELPNSADVLLDNIQIYGYNPAPSLVITEIATNGYGVYNNDYGEAVMKNGGFQWVEVYNPTQKPVNVYDYALYVNNDPAAQSTFGGAAEPTAEPARLSGLGYLKAGVQSFTLADGVTQGSYENPAYEDGVLQPGENAILILPETLHATGKALKAEDVARDMRRMNMPAGTKVLMCDDDTVAPFVLAASGPMVIGLMEVENAGQEDVVGKYVGYDDSLNMLLESYVLMTTEGINAQKVYDGLAVYNYVPINVAFGADKKTVEISYWDLYNSTITSQRGWPKYDAEDARQTANGEDGYVTPGYVPTVCRFNVSITVYDWKGENPQVVNGKFMDAWAMDDTTIIGYKFLGYSVNGSEELCDSVFMEEGIEVVPVYARVAPETIGAQVSEMTAEGTYAVRILAGVNRTDIESVGFKYSYTYVNSYGTTITVTPEEAYQCQYVYTAVSVNGEVKNASELGDYEYLFALHLTDIPEAVGEITITVTSFFIESKNTVDQPIEDVEKVITIEAPAPFVPEDSGEA